MPAAVSPHEVLDAIDQRARLNYPGADIDHIADALHVHYADLGEPVEEALHRGWIRVVDDTGFEDLYALTDIGTGELERWRDRD